MAAHVGLADLVASALHRPRPRRLPDGPRLPEGERSERPDRPRCASCSRSRSSSRTSSTSSTSPASTARTPRSSSSRSARGSSPTSATSRRRGRSRASSSVQTKRSLIGVARRRRSPGRVGFEANVLPCRSRSSCAAGGLDLVPRTGLVEQLRAVKDDGELDDDPARVRDHRPDVRAARDRDAVRRPHASATSRGTSQRLFHEEGADGLAFESIVGSGPTGALPHGRAGDRIIEPGELVVDRHGLPLDGYFSDYTRTLRDRRARRRAAARRTTSCLAAQLAGLDGDPRRRDRRRRRRGARAT